MADRTRVTDRDPIKAMQQAMVALALEVPQPVHADVKKRWNAVVDEVERLRDLLSRVPVEAWDRKAAAPAGTKWVEVSHEMVDELREWSEPVQIRIEDDRGDVVTMLVRDYEADRKRVPASEVNDG